MRLPVDEKTFQFPLSMKSLTPSSQPCGSDAKFPTSLVMLQVCVDVGAIAPVMAPLELEDDCQL